MQKVINAHCHIYPQKIASRAVAGIRAFYGLGEHPTLNGMTDGLIKDGERVGTVHYLVHSVATKPEQVKSINEFIASEVREHPGIFTGFGTLHPNSEDIRADLDHLLELGLSGVKLHPDFQGFSLTGKRAEVIGKAISDSGVPVLIHCGDKRYNYSNPPQMREFLDKYPDITVIGAHLGGWEMWEEACELLAGIPNLYVDCCSSLSYLDSDVAADIIRAYGTDRVLWGTDYPMWDSVSEMGYFKKLNLEEREEEQILYSNAAELLGVES